MSVSKKDFETIASAIGQAFYMERYESGKDNSINWENLPQETKIVIRGLVNAFEELNPLFDEGRFIEWVEDVAARRRDINGKKIN